MELIKITFKRAKETLAKIEVRKGPGNFYLEDIQDLSTHYPASFDLTPEQSELSPEEAKLGLFKLMTINFYDANGNSLDLSSLIKTVREELNENLSMPLDIILKRSYLNEIIDFYSKMESEIVEDKDGNLSYDNVKFYDFNFDQLDKKDMEIYFNMLDLIKKTLRSEIRDLYNIKKNLFKDQINKKPLEDVPSKNNLIEKGKSSGSNFSKRNSFEINPNLYSSNPQKLEPTLDEKLKNFHQALNRYEFIEKIEFRDFNRIFTNKPVKKLISWKGDANELYYLMKTLYDEKIIVRFKDYWKVTCKCFIANHKKTGVCTADSIARCHKPTRNVQLVELNSVIDTLRK